MKRYFPIFLVLISLLSCSKSDGKIEEPKSNEINLAENQGALFVGSTVEGKSYDLALKIDGKTFSGFIQGRANNKSLTNCTLSSNSIGHTYRVAAGKYTLEFKNPAVSGEEPKVIQVEIKPGKCLSLNVDGHAW